MVKEFLLIDAKDKIMGRLASKVAKLALLGKQVIVINAKDIVISGSKKNIFEKYNQRKNIKTRTNPTRGPFFYRRPDRFFRRVVRGMLPFKQNRGQEAYRRIKVYTNDIDRSKFKNLVEHEVKDVSADRLNRNYITLETVSGRFGWKNFIE